MKTHSIILNISRSAESAPPVLKIKQYENQTQLLAYVYDGSEFYDGEFDSVTLEMTKRDGKGVMIHGEYADGLAKFTLNSQFTPVYGTTMAEVVFRGAEYERISSANFYVNIERASLGDGLDISDSELAPVIDLARSNQAAAEAALVAGEKARDASIAAKEAAEAAQSAAEEHSSDSEAYAVGKRDGVDVGADDDAYQNNAKFYAAQASGSASAASGSASAAAASKAAAETAENKAEEHSSDSEAYAVGKRDGVDVGADDDAYQNNAKFYAAQASGSASAALSSANDAAGSANAAETHAGNAANKAAEAETSADAAETARNEAEEFRNQAAGYAGAASYSFYVKSTDGLMYMRYKEGE